MITVNDRPEMQVFYHGSSSNAGIDCMLLPPTDTDTLSEVGRNKNLDRIFFTSDIGLAKIYAGRAARSLGGKPVLYRVVCPVDVVCMDSRKGASVYHAAYSFAEKLN